MSVNSKPLCFICLNLQSLEMHLGKCKLSCVSCADNGRLPLLRFSAHLLLKSYHAPRLKLNCYLLQLQGLHVFSIVPYFVDFVDLL